jgi:DNA mismatch repair protein MutS
VCNKSVAVREWQDEIVFLHKIVEGGTDRSYGIHVARLAGVPGELLDRAKQILADLEHDAEDLAPRISQHSTSPSKPRAAATQQLSLFASPSAKLESELAKLDPDHMTPIDALLALKRLREML